MLILEKFILPHFFFIQGFIRIDMSEYQEKHEVSTREPNVETSWVFL